MTASDPRQDALITPSPLLRLHGLSWLFVLITQLRALFFPLLVLVFFGRGEWWQVFLLIGAGGYALYAFIYSIGFRYRICGDEIFVKEGIFARTERHIPFARIQNIVRRRNPLHRLFDVTELRLESAGGTSPEAVMNVITVAAADQIEDILRHGAGHAQSSDAQYAVPTPALLTLTSLDLVRLGLMRQRGGLLIGAAIAFAFQLDLWESRNARGYLRLFGEWMSIAVHQLSGPTIWILGALAFVLIVYGLMQLFSIAWAIFNYHGFVLKADGTRVSTEFGLLTRHAASARLEKVQRLVYGESLLARHWGYRWLSCDVAAGKGGDEDDKKHSRLRWLAPIAPAQEVLRIAEEIAPGLGLEQHTWESLHPGAARRVFIKSALIWSAASFVSGVLFLGYYAAIIWLALIVFSAFEARSWARFSAFACDGVVLAFRSGFLTREWVVAKVVKGQGIELSSSPFDRRAQMANVEMTTAGASSEGSRLRIPYMAEAEARALFARVRAGIDASGAH